MPERFGWVEAMRLVDPELGTPGWEMYHSRERGTWALVSPSGRTYYFDFTLKEFRYDH